MKITNLLIFLSIEINFINFTFSHIFLMFLYLKIISTIHNLFILIIFLLIILLIYEKDKIVFLNNPYLYLKRYLHYKYSHLLKIHLNLNLILMGRHKFYFCKIEIFLILFHFVKYKTYSISLIYVY